MIREIKNKTFVTEEIPTSVLVGNEIDPLTKNGGGDVGKESAILTQPMNPPLNFFFSAIVCIGFIRVTVASQLVLAKIGALLLYLLSNQYSIYFSWRSFPPFSSEGVEGSVVILDLSAPPMGNPLMFLFSLVWFIFRYWNIVKVELFVVTC